MSVKEVLLGYRLTCVASYVFVTRASQMFLETVRGTYEPYPNVSWYFFQLFIVNSFVLPQAILVRLL